MKRIDFLGAPGVGKSTLYRKLLHERNRRKQWFTMAEARIFIAKHYVRRNYNSMKEFARLIALYTTNIRVLQNKLSENICASLANKSFKDRLEKWMPFIEVCSESLGDRNKDPYYRLLLAKWLLSKLNDVALVENAEPDNIVIFDESLSQRAAGLMPWDFTLGERQSRKYFNLMPPPNAVIILRLEPQHTLKRLINKKRFIVQHQGLSDNDLLERTKIATMIVEVGAEVLRERRIRTLELDALTPVDEMAIEAKKFINTGNLRIKK